MGEIEHVGRSPAEAPAGAVVPHGPARVTYSGRPVTYKRRIYDNEASWQLLSPEMRAWTEEHAGSPIKDPHTGASTVYWYCDVEPDHQDGPSHAAVPATYELVMFGRQGLAVSTGTTAALDGVGGATRWRHERRALPIDATGIRNDHRTDLPAEVAAAGPSGGSAGASPEDTSALLPPGVIGNFGNLPEPTQHFLLEPFATAGKPPFKTDLYPSTREWGSSYVETYVFYAFSKRWLAFAYCARSVGLISGMKGDALWNGSPEADAVAAAPWNVSAWVAPVATAEQAGPPVLQA